MGFRKKMEWWYTSIFCCNIHFLKKIKHRGDAGTPWTPLKNVCCFFHSQSSPGNCFTHRRRSSVARSAPQSPELHRIRHGCFVFLRSTFRILKVWKRWKRTRKKKVEHYVIPGLDFWKGTYSFYITAHEYDISLSFQFATLDYRSKHTLQHDNEHWKTFDFRWMMSYRNPGSYQWQW